MPRRSDPRKLAVWRERFERFSSCGVGVGLFCAREGVSTASFYHWRKKLGINGQPTPRSLLGPKGRRRSATEGPPRLRSRPTDRHSRLRAGPADGRGRFQRVAVIPGTSPVLPTAPATGLPAGMVCIQLPCGTRMEVSAEDLDALRAVIAEVVRADHGSEGVTPAFGGQVMRADCGRGAGAASC